MNIAKRIYADFFRPNKYGEYEKIISTAKSKGYEFHTILSFEEELASGLDKDKKYLVLRRDVDTGDNTTLKVFLDIEKKYGARATYYFRWNTLNVRLMNDIAAAGGESSYHYEEIASFCYKNRIKNKEEALSRISEIRDLFVSNIEKFRSISQQPCLTVASHGEYVNTLFLTPNTVILDEETRKRSGIIREAYDNERMKFLSFRLADQSANNFTEEALSAISRGEPVLELLTHPRQWNSPVLINLKEELSRLVRGLYMRM